MSKKLNQIIASFSNEVDLISPPRKSELEDLAKLIAQHLEAFNSLDIIVICTHNSRRSQLGEVWINTLTQYFELKGITAFSGGMETTAFNIRMVNALKDSGFDLEEVTGGDNPRYTLEGMDMDDHLMFSKVYDDPANPQQEYLALMVCGHADENCPIVHGMKYRVPLRYKDPKEFDDTEKESEAYTNKVKEIGREIYFLLNQVNRLS